MLGREFVSLEDSVVDRVWGIFVSWVLMCREFELS